MRKREYRQLLRLALSEVNALRAVQVSLTKSNERKLARNRELEDELAQLRVKMELLRQLDASIEKRQNPVYYTQLSPGFE